MAGWQDCANGSNPQEMCIEGWNSEDLSRHPSLKAIDMNLAMPGLPIGLFRTYVMLTVLYARYVFFPGPLTLTY